jgi:hypothetical protein
MFAFLSVCVCVCGGGGNAVGEELIVPSRMLTR